MVANGRDWALVSAFTLDRSHWVQLHPIGSNCVLRKVEGVGHDHRKDQAPGGGGRHSTVEPTVLDVDGVLAYVQPMTRTRLYEEIAAGHLASFKIGRRLAFDRTAVDAWVAGLER